MNNRNLPDGVYKTITSESDLKDLVYIINDFYTEISIDTETTSVEPLTCELVGISISHKVGYGYYIPVQRYLQQKMLWDDPSGFLTVETVREHLNPILANESISKVLHNAKYDLHVLGRYGFEIRGPIFDTMICAWVLGNVSMARYGLKHLTKTKLGFEMLEYKEVAGNKPFYLVDLPLATKYASADTDMTLRLKSKEMEVLANYPSLTNTLTLELAAVPALKRMEEKGTPLDVKYLEQSGKLLNAQARILTNRIYDEFNCRFNINSPDQLLQILNRNKINVTSTDEASLKANEDKHPGIRSILEYRKRLKLKSVYVEGMLSKLRNGRIHTEFYQMLKTGRLSSSGPNLQNIPAYSKDGLPSIRQAFVAPVGCKFVCIDYSQLELRVITHVAEEPYWIEAFKNNFDIHKATAAVVNKIDMSDVTDYQRKQAKFTNFGLLYGESAYGLSNRTGMSKEEAERFIEEYFSVLPKIQDYVETTKELVKTRKYVETFNGRRLYFKYDANEPKQISACQREGINFPIQGGAADIVKSAMVEIDRLLLGSRFKTELVLQVHDELDFLMPEDEMPILIPRIVDIMENVFTLKVDLKVDVEYGNNWQDLEKWS